MGQNLTVLVAPVGALIMKKTLIFCRVSSREQEESGYSLPAQRKLLEEYTNRLDLNVVKVFSISESAGGNKQRKIFNEMLSYLEANRIEALIVEKTDRLSRNLKDAVAINDWVAKKAENQVHFVKENFILSRDSRSNEKFIWNIKVTVAQLYIDNLSEEVKKGQKEKLAQGWLPTKPPFGYKSAGEEGRRTHIPDEVTKPIVIWMFNTYASGCCSLLMLTDTLNGKLEPLTGKKLSRSMVHRYLTNPFYIGMNTWNGKVTQGSQETYIDKDTFDKVQEILTGRHAPKQQKHSFIFRKLITCKECGGTITWEKKKERNYGHCSHYRDCKQKGTVKDYELEEKLLPAFKVLKIKDKDLLNWIRKALKETHTTETTDYSSVLKTLNTRETRVKKRLGGLYTDKLDGVITEEFYDEKNAEFLEERSSITSQREKLNIKDKKFYERSVALYDVAQKADKAYSPLTPDKKRNLLNIVFKNMELYNGEFTFEYSKNYKLLYEAVKATNSSKISGNTKLKEEILEQKDFAGVKANIKGFEDVRTDWLGDRDSNPNFRDQNPACYHYTIPHQTLQLYCKIRQCTI
jgi:site-specific DNA recombinase